MQVQPHNLTPEVPDLDRAHIQEMINSGMSDAELKQALLDSGYSEAQVNKLLTDLPFYANPSGEQRINVDSEA